MNEPQHRDERGWTALKVLGLIAGLIAMLGFGVCGLCGLVMGIQQRGLREISWPLGLAGLVIAFFGFVLVRRVLRSTRPEGPPGP